MRPSEKYNLHPPSHSLDALDQTSFDVICIGSGWAGRVLATRVAKAGLSVLIIEKELFGGDCPFWACVPSKLMLFPNEALQTAKSVGAIVDAQLDPARVFHRRDEFILNRDDDKMIVPGLLEAGISLVRSAGKLTGTREVVVTGSTTSKMFDAKIAVAICSGSDPVIPESLRNIDPWTPRDASSATIAPASLIVVGGGVVGCEMATAYASFRTQVILVSSSKTLLPALDDEVGTVIADALRQKGVQVVLGKKVASASRADGRVIAKLSDDTEIQGSELLIAAGRKLVLDVGLETVGLAPAKTISTNSSLQVAMSDNSTWLYALGDANGLAPFTHAAKHHGRIAANVILGNGPQIPAQIMPQVIFTQPNVASVGLTAKAAKQQGVAVRAVQAAYQTIASSIQGDGDPGFAQCVVDNQDRVVGFTFVGHNAGEVIHAGTTAIVAGMTLSDLVSVVSSFPTCAEVYLNLLDAAGY